MTASETLRSTPEPDDAPVIGRVHRRLRDAVLARTGVDLLPRPDIIRRYEELDLHTDPLAEAFVSDVHRGGVGYDGGRAMIEAAVAGGLDAVDTAVPPSLRALIDDFERLPEWADVESIRRGAAVWRRWGYDMGTIANAGTMDTYTEGWLAVPLTLGGGYVDGHALRRHLETSRWWLECARDGSVFTRGSRARQISMHVRLMHVSIRQGVRDHDDWRPDVWGEPISQSNQLLTLIAGSVAPALGLYAQGYLTSPREIRECLHFCRYLGHLLGVSADGIYPETIADALRVLFYFDATRRHDGGDRSALLVESFVPSFAPQDGDGALDRLRARYHSLLQTAGTALFMLPWNRRRYDLPNPVAGLIVNATRIPLVLVVEMLRRPFPALDEWWQRQSMRSWERWIVWAQRGEARDYHPVTEFR